MMAAQQPELQAQDQAPKQADQGDQIVVAFSVDEADRIVRDYEIETTTRFCKKTSKGHNGHREVDLDKVMKGHRLYFTICKYPDGAAIVEGLPHFVLGRSYYECQHGKDHWRASQNKKTQNEPKQQDHTKSSNKRKRHNITQPSRKFECPCRLVMIDVVAFPDNKLLPNTKRARTVISRKIHNDISSFRTERRVYIQLPPIGRHNHPTGQAASINQTMDKRVINEIKEYCKRKGAGVTSKEVSRYIQYFVTTKLFPDGNCPNRNNRRFFPLIKDIQNHMYKARTQRIKGHQSDLQSKLDEWRSNPAMSGDFIFLRKEREVSGKVSKSQLLYVHQTPTQQRLLELYGNEMTVLDAAYKTTRYDMPLFLLAVPTNCDYQIVGEFVIAKDTSETIEEALRVIKSHNPNWNPKCWMVDHSDEQEKAVEAVFFESQVFVCDFHREQAWERWLSKASNKMVRFKETLLTKMGRLAQARSEKEYKQALHDLKASHEWDVDDAKTFRQWFTNTWIKKCEKWVWAYRDQHTMPSVNTNKGVESQTKALRHQYLEKRRHLSLADMLTCIVKEYIPTKYASYVSTNSLWSSQYRKYSSELDPSLHDRPRPFIDHCRKCIGEAEDIPSYKVHRSYNEAIFSVGCSSSDGSEYLHQVDLSKPSCTCYDFKHTGWPCKHMFVIFARCSGWNISRLPKSFLDSPFLNVDRDIVFTNAYEATDTAIEEVLFQDSFDDDTAECFTEEVETYDDRQNIDGIDITQSPAPKRPKTEASKLEASINELSNLSQIVTDPAVLKQVRLVVEGAVKMMTSHLETEGAISSILTR